MKRILILIQVILLVSCVPTKKSANLDLSKNILVIAAHEDDEVIGPGILINRAINSGVNVTVVVTTDGAPKEFGHGAFEASVRKNETIEALGVLGVKEEDILFLEYDDLGFIFEVDVQNETNRIKRIIEDVNPDAVYVHAYEGGHVDHDATHRLVVNAIADLNYTGKTYEFIEYNAYKWGGAIPEEEDQVDNIECPVEILAPVETEEQAKKDALKKYISQHPVKKNLIAKNDTGFKIIHLSATINGEEVKGIQNGTHYLKLGEAAFFYPIELTPYGQSLIKNPNPTEREKLQLLMTFDKFIHYPYDTCAPKPENTLIEIDGSMLNYESRAKCYPTAYFEAPCTEEEKNHWSPHDHDGIQTCEEYKRKVLDEYSTMNIEIKKDIQKYELMFPDGIPESVRKNFRRGQYYVVAENPNFLGTFRVKPSSNIVLTLEFGNLLNKAIENVTLAVDFQGYLRQGLNLKDQVIDLGKFDPKTIKLQEIEINIPLHVDFEHNIYNLHLTLNGSSEGAHVQKDHYLGVEVTMKNHEIVIYQIGSRDYHRKFGDGISCFYLFLTNLGKEPAEYTVNVHSKELGIDINHTHNDVRYCTEFFTYDLNGNLIPNKYCPDPLIPSNEYIGKDIYIPVSLTGLPTGEYKFLISLFNKYDDLKDQKTVTVFLDENGSYEVIEYIAEYGSDLLVSPPIIKPEIKYSKECEENYLVCLFYWPDMIRGLPKYDYTKPPAEKIAYEEQIQTYCNKTFEDFLNVFPN
ncbi:PIG-L family deacetylase [Candidatus Woesearchaeota archaeon]|nr:PIG-L family deacetylase [Candidatus Woesearchaeota archaeon]